MKKLIVIAIAASLAACKKEYKKEEPEPAHLTVQQRLDNGEKPHTLLKDFPAAEIVGKIWAKDTICFVNDTVALVYKTLKLQSIWGSWYIETPECKDTTLFAGEKNTDYICKANPSNSFRVAAKECRREGYFLPSIQELFLLNKKGCYWSSNQRDKEYGYIVAPDKKAFYLSAKMNYYNVIGMKKIK
jgi:hypothetical protein